MNNEIYEILNKFKTKTEAYNYFNICQNSNAIVKLNKIANDANFDLNIYKERRKPKKKYTIEVHMN